MDVAENLQDPPQQDKSAQMRKTVPFWQCAGVFLLSAGLAQRLILSLIGQESVEIIHAFAWYVFTVIALETALLLFLAWISTSANAAEASHPWHSGKRFAGALALVLVFNVLGLLLSYTEFAGWSLLGRLACLAAAWAVIYAVFLYGARVLFIGLALLGVSLNLETSFQVWQKSRPVTDDNALRQTVLDRFKPVSFVRKPNVYLISWDAIVSEVIAEEFLDIPPGSLGYANYVKNNDFRVFNNAFRDRGMYPSAENPELNRILDPKYFGGTGIVHNQILFFDPSIWDTLPGRPDHIYKDRNSPGQLRYFAGERESPLYRIFRNNGYKIMTSADGLFLGTKKGDYIDEFINLGTGYGQCLFSLEWHHFQGLGFCQYWDERVLRHYTPLLKKSEIQATHTYMFPSLQVPMLLPILAKNAESKTPWLSFIHIWSPGHAPGSYYNHADASHRQSWAGQFKKVSAEAGRYMKVIMHAIRSSDPNAIVLFFGDHGMFLTVKWTKDDLKTEEDVRLHFLDSHAVMAALYPENACAEYMQFDQKYVTVSMLVRALVVCLADGDDPIDWEVDYSSPYDGIRFEDYLYE